VKKIAYYPFLKELPKSIYNYLFLCVWFELF